MGAGIEHDRRLRGIEVRTSGKRDGAVFRIDFELEVFEFDSKPRRDLDPNFRKATNEDCLAFEAYRKGESILRGWGRTFTRTAEKEGEHTADQSRPHDECLS